MDSLECIRYKSKPLAGIIDKEIPAESEVRLEIIADTHIHIYPDHDPAALIIQSARRLARAASSADPVCALFLAEAGGFSYFDRLSDGTHGLPERFLVEGTDSDGAVSVKWGEGESVLILAGRQIVTVERLEVLGLAMTGEVEGGRPAEEIVEAILARGGIPVLAWAPGKWLFRRAAAVRRLLRTFGPESLLLGDTSLRPLGWPEPAAMREPGRLVLAGSDPLPLAGEEAEAGGYGVALGGDFDRDRPAASIRRLLGDPTVSLRRVGRRNPPWRAAGRLIRHHRRKPGTL